MHFIFATRGIYASTQQMIMDLCAQRFPWRRIDRTPGSPNEGKIVDGYMQGMLRPVMLWEYVFPEQSPKNPGDPNSPMEDNLPLVLRGFDLTEGGQHFEPKALDWGVKLMRSKLGLTEIPKVGKAGPQLMIHQHGISTVPIGVKKDGFAVKSFPDGHGGTVTYEQELL